MNQIITTNLEKHQEGNKELKQQQVGWSVWGEKMGNQERPMEVTFKQAAKGRRVTEKISRK